MAKKKRNVPRELSPHEVTTLIRVERASGIYTPASVKGKRTAGKLIKRGYMTAEDEYGKTVYYITRRGAQKARALWLAKSGRGKEVKRAVKVQRRGRKRAIKRQLLSEKEQQKRLTAALRG
jgi:hypothetical protein